ncbi:MAG: T9SS type A sorting domain-containing protein [Flavobacteriales bacterium]|nr:T9SS type A sorting domain-containing protein [Flavobacteriales bacterium]
MKIKLWILALVLTKVSLGQNLVVDISSTNEPNEISICIDKENPNKLVAGANIYSLFSSEDSGLSWNRFEASSTFGVWGDPVIIQDTAGSFYHLHLSNVPGGNWIDRIVCQRSDDGGKTFNNGSFFGLDGKKAQDKPWAVVNPLNNEIYVTWTQFDKYGSDDPIHRSNILFTKSDDRGETWAEPTKINTVDGDCVDDDKTVEGAVPAVGPNGEIYVAWSGPNGLAFNRSFDGGRTWEENEIQITDHIGGWSIDIEGIYRANGMPVTKCDLSGGANSGTIYVNWAAEQDGQTDIYLTTSDNHGDAWSEPIRVNQDDSNRDQFFTWMDIDQTNGNLWLVYHDRRHTTGNETDVYSALSQDGGRSFQEIKLTETPFKPNDQVFFGDYNNITAHNNVVRPVWTRLDEKKLTVQTSIVNPHPFFLSEKNLITTSFESNGAIEINHNLRGRRFLISVYDLNGTLVGAKEKVKSKNGMISTKIFAQILEGVYWVEISNGSETAKGQWIKKH